ncbi:MAG: hypothetical protein LBC97_07170, partial [Bifidobacteriaceae bacterium]|nr:hypothetical protein [Bifidobacteriaceae bacterium]
MTPGATDASDWSPGQFVRVDKSDPAPPELCFNGQRVPLLTRDWATPEGPDKFYPEETFSSLELPAIDASLSGGLKIHVSSQTVPLTVIVKAFDAINQDGIPTHEAGLYIFDSQTHDLDVATGSDGLEIQLDEGLAREVSVVVVELSYGLSASDLSRMPQYDMSWRNRAS